MKVQKYGKYTWSGYLGHVLNSKENGVSEGDIRQLDNRLIYANQVINNIFTKNFVVWCLVGKIEYSDIRKFHGELFGVYHG